MKRFRIALALDRERSIVLGAYPTTNGVSFGPEIPGKSVHVTWFTRDGYFNSHLTVVERGRTTYTPLVHEPVAEFWSGILQQLRKCGLNRPYDADEDALFLTEKGMRYLETSMQSAISVSMNRRTARLDIMLIPFIEGVMPKLASNEMVRYGRARELLALPPLFRVGLSKDMRPLTITDRGEAVTNPIEKDSWMPLLDNALGFNALLQALGPEGLRGFIKSRTAPRS